MKYVWLINSEETLSPTPCGVGGLKYLNGVQFARDGESHPVRGGWIEIIKSAVACRALSSHPVRGGWIEMAQAHYPG